VEDILRALKGRLIVSCQASKGEPLCAPEHIVALSLSALNGGASALRLEGAENVAAVRAKTKVPIVALTKSEIPDNARLSSVYITPTYADAKSLADAGADVVALDATIRARPGGESLKQIVERIHKELAKLVWADLSSFADAQPAVDAGVDILSTTLSGYTAETQTPHDAGPDFKLLERLCQEFTKPVMLEGRVWTPEEVRRAFELGAHAVVVGSAITRPQLITRRFTDVTPAARAVSQT
jgi:N-acylglucosamine-6-phosphate 2-epimerase